MALYREVWVVANASAQRLNLNKSLAFRVSLPAMAIRRCRALALWLLLALTCVCPNLAAADNRKPAVAQSGVGTSNTHVEVESFTLDNGLTVWVSENHELPQIFGAVVVRAGAKHDPAHATGIAHYLEHMLFKGTQELGTADWGYEAPRLEHIRQLYETLGQTEDPKTRASLLKQIDAVSQAAGRVAIPNEFDRLLQEIGSTGVNAFTTPDITVYHNAFPASRLPQWLELYAHRFEQPVFRLFQSELEAVYEEKNRSMDGFEPLVDVFLGQFFRRHPYRLQGSVLGRVEHLKNPSLGEMQKFYDTYYVANNMGLMLAGDISVDEVKPLVKQAFGDWRSGTVPEFPDYPEPTFRGREQVTVRMTPVRVAGMGFRTVPEGHPDYAALLVCNRLLTNPQQSGFLDNLARDGGVLLTQAVPIPLHDHGIQLVAFAPRIVFQSFASAERRVRAQFERLKRGDFDDATLRGVRRSLVNEYRLKFESNNGRVVAMADVFGRGASWASFNEFLDELATIDRAAVQRVAARYFGDNYLMIHSRAGHARQKKLDKPGFRPIKPSKAESSNYAERVRKLPTRTVKPRFIDPSSDITRVEVRPGVTLLHHPNPMNDVYTLELVWGIGQYDLRELSLLDDYLADVGSAALGAKKFKHELFALATTLVFETREEEFIARLTGPEANLAAAVELVGGLMRKPELSRKALRAIRQERRGYGFVNRRQSATVADALREYVTFGDKSKYVREYSPTEMLRISPKQLASAWQAAQGYALKVRYTGQTTPTQVAALISQKLDLRASYKPATPMVVRPRTHPQRDTVYFVRHPRSIQSQIIVTVGGDPVTAPQRPALHAFNEYFGGSMAGILFQEVRELRSLAYSTRAMYIEHPVAGQPGMMYMHIGTQGDKTIEAIGVLRDLLDHMPRKPGRLPGLRSALVESQLAATPGFRSVLQTVDDWRWLGYNSDPRREWLAHYPGLSFTELEAFYRQQIADRPRSILVVGDPKRVKKRELRRYGEVVTVPRHRLGL